MRARADLHESLALEGVKSTAEVARVKAQAFAKVPKLDAVWSNLPEQPSLTHRTASVEKSVVHGAEAFGHGSVETSHLPNCGRIHFSDYSQRFWPCQVR